jgi:transcriptional regulator with XRE-family HTH domain
MAKRKTPQRFTTGGFVWGQRRIEAGVSMRELARLSGVASPILSQCERGRMIPTAEEFSKVMAALEAAVSREAAGSSIPVEPVASPI